VDATPSDAKPPSVPPGTVSSTAALLQVLPISPTFGRWFESLCCQGAVRDAPDDFNVVKMLGIAARWSRTMPIEKLG